MKLYSSKIAILFSILSGIFSLSSCYREDPGPLQETKEQYSIVDFDELEMGSALIIDVKQSEFFSITAEGDTRNVDDLRVHKDGNTLIVKYADDDNYHNRKHDTYIKITMPSLRGVKFSGASDSNVSGFSDEEMEVILSGASSSQINVNPSKMYIKLSGASNLRMTGETPIQDVDVSGASTLSAFAFTAEEADVKVSGASSAKVSVTDKLNASARGASNILYRGTPAVSSHTSGASSIKQD